MAVKKAKQSKSSASKRNVDVNIKVKKIKKTKAVESKAKVKAKVKAKAKAKVKVSVKSKVATKAKPKAQKSQICREKQTRIEILQTLAEKSNLTKSQVEVVFDELNNLMVGHLRKKGSGEFTIPKTGVKILRVKKKASKSRTMVSPLTGQEVTIAAKPARFAVKVTALKTLKEMAEK